MGNPGLDCEEFCCLFSFFKEKRKIELSACIMPLLIQITSGPWKEAVARLQTWLYPLGKYLTSLGLSYLIIEQRGDVNIPTSSRRIHVLSPPSH